MGKIYLVTYRALARNKAGTKAIEKYDLPLYIDSSCRREPDFEAQYPSISALCRGRIFAPRLKLGDVVVYMTKKGRFPGEYTLPHRRLTAILRVYKRFNSHEEASNWYSERGLPLPSNCMVKGNPPIPLDHTDGLIESLEKWDAGYKKRARLCGIFLACEPLYRQLLEPSIITDDMLREVFGRIPPTLNPPAISLEYYRDLTRLCGIDSA